MPKLKQPEPLKELVFDFIVTHCASYCHQLSVKGDLEKLRQSITEIKLEVFSWLPPILGQHAEFCEKFFETFLGFGYDLLKSSGRVRPLAHNRAAVEIMMDVEIRGLRCSDLHLEYLDSPDYCRFQNIDALKMHNPPYEFVNHNVLRCFRLENLTQLWMISWCGDRELEIIGRRCRKLQLLNIMNSVNVSEEGLRALRPCTDLRVIDFRGCASKLTNNAVNRLLSDLKKLEEFNVIEDEYFPGRDEIKTYDPCSRRQTLVCPSMKRYCFRGSVQNSDLDAVVTLFPHLTHLQFCCEILGDLRKLQNLQSLKELSFWGSYSVIRHLGPLLKIIGENISVIKLNLPTTVVGHLSQLDVNFVHEYCKNIQEFVFAFRPRMHMDELLIRSFMKLKKLAIEHCYMRIATIEFQEMPELEDLTLVDFEPIVDIISSIMLDNTRFGKLKTFYSPTLDSTDHQRLHDLNQIAKERNLDFSIVFLDDCSL
ncbi:uncharacterized protein LOC124308473 isoform X1 [Neodiprion virginianus]|uniref:uncharacterized protein LOC124308473 isoform X1 n=2 Tax=Neodiprion virginianus TaxID=2961670 RepID=UPI001EE6AEB9|nr:uncharacterized protein LOC124308473 isoform X1 [Neodiprion virginianus]